jgi:hypothetical protein
MARYNDIAYSVLANASDMVLLDKQTASSSATISFTKGIDSTYKEYIIHYVTIHPGTNNANMSFQCSIDSGSNYNIATTNTIFHAFHYEDNSGTPYVAIDTGRDLAQGTGFSILLDSIGSDNDQSGSGYVHLFNPSSTTFMKHFIARGVTNTQNDGAIDVHAAGYFNTTSAIDAIQFKLSTGNMDSGTIKLYGVS